MSETRTQAATLLCKVFLHYLVRLVERGRMRDVWLKVLDVLDRMMNSGQSGAAGNGLVEQIPESLKNILLVMADGGYLTPPGSAERDGRSEERLEVEDREGDGVIWEETRRRLDRFLPGLFAQIFPEQLQQTRAPAPEPKTKQKEKENKSEGEDGKKS